jgi:hypothetical protein
MNLAVGGNFGGNPDSTTVFPGEMLVDYVRVYTGSAPPPPPPPPPVLKLRFPFNDARGSTTTVSDTNGVALALQMLNSSGVAADYHGTANSGVGNPASGNRALNFSSNGANQPGNPGPSAAVTNASLGFGVMTNFVVSMWFKQNAMMPTGGNIGPRLFVLGNGTPSDTGAANSIGVKFQMANQLYFQIGSTTVSASFANNLPTNVWIFIAGVFDGANLLFYEGTETNSASLISVASASSVDFGANGALFVGNRLDRTRSFDGWNDDLRFYSGTSDINFVESVRQLGLAPAALTFQHGSSGLMLNWSNGFLQSATNVIGPWLDVSNASSPFFVAPIQPRQYYRLRFQ